MAEQDREDLVPAVLNDLIDVDGTAAEGQMLRFDGEVWRPRTDAPLRWWTGNCATFLGHDGVMKHVPLLPDTDVAPGTPAASGDVVFADGTIESYTDGIQCLKVVNSGTYILTFSGGANAAQADDNLWVYFEAYVTLNDENYGPLWWPVPKQSVLVDWPTQVALRLAASCTLHLQAGDELGVAANYRGTADSSLTNVVGDIYRLA